MSQQRFVISPRPYLAQFIAPLKPGNNVQISPSVQKVLPSPTLSNQGLAPMRQPITPITSVPSQGFRSNLTAGPQTTLQNTFELLRSTPTPQSGQPPGSNNIFVSPLSPRSVLAVNSSNLPIISPPGSTRLIKPRQLLESRTRTPQSVALLPQRTFQPTVTQQAPNGRAIPPTAPRNTINPSTGLVGFGNVLVPKDTSSIQQPPLSTIPDQMGIQGQYPIVSQQMGPAQPKPAQRIGLQPSRVGIVQTPVSDYQGLSTDQKLDLILAKLDQLLNSNLPISKIGNQRT